MKPLGTIRAIRPLLSAIGCLHAQEMGAPCMERNLKAYLPRHASDPQLRIETLCRTAKRREVEMLRMRSNRYGMYRILLTARHDAHDAVGTYLLEGVFGVLLGDGETGRSLREQTETLAIPFVDKDGVEDGASGQDFSAQGI